jgi:hypothetical protein
MCTENFARCPHPKQTEDSNNKDKDAESLPTECGDTLGGNGQWVGFDPCTPLKEKFPTKKDQKRIPDNCSNKEILTQLVTATTAGTEMKHTCDTCGKTFFTREMETVEK